MYFSVWYRLLTFYVPILIKFFLYLFTLFKTVLPRYMKGKLFTLKFHLEHDKTMMNLLQISSVIPNAVVSHNFPIPMQLSFHESFTFRAQCFSNNYSPQRVTLLPPVTPPKGVDLHLIWSTFGYKTGWLKRLWGSWT